jgi:hypothetical protein
MKKIFLLFIGSFLVTAVFSASLKVFFQAISWREVLIKGLLIPCFTWTIQLVMAITLHVLLRRDGFRWQWTLSWLMLIVINMTLYLSSVL